jgi:hypothetical protein
MNDLANALLHSMSGRARRPGRCGVLLAESIDDPAIERKLGTDDCEIESLDAGQRDERVGMPRIDGQSACVARDASVSGNAGH